MRTTVRRGVPLVLTALLATGTGPAVAAPAAGDPGTGIGYANALLYGEDLTGGGGVESLFTVYASQGVPAFGRGEVFLGGYECLTEDSVPARVTGLESARATGRLRYECGSPEGTVRGAAFVHLRWTGRGEVTEQSWTDDAGCLVTLRVRPADVTGGMLVAVPGVGVAALTLNAPDDADVRQERTTCA
jgi:hypothetical protein